MLVTGENLGIAIGETQKYYLIVTFILNEYDNN